LAAPATVRLGVTRRCESGIGLGFAAGVIWSSSVGALVSLLGNSEAALYPLRRSAERRMRHRQKTSAGYRPACRHICRPGAFFRSTVPSGGAPIVIYLRANSRVTEEAEVTVPDEDKKRAAHRALVDRVLNGEGRATAEQRAHAFGNDGLAPPLHALIDKVVTRPAQVTEADLAAATASGLSEDEVFELVICAAVGRSARLYEAGLAALAEATADGEAR
jgi:hypothetical protein